MLFVNGARCLSSLDYTSNIIELASEREKEREVSKQRAHTLIILRMIS